MLRVKETEHWWSAPCGMREVLGIALPLLISTGSYTLQVFIDRMFLFWYSPESMSATMAAGMLYWTLICFPVGVASYLNSFVAQYLGAGRPESIGRVTWQALRIGLYGAPLFLLAIPFAPAIFRAAGHEESLLWQEVIYFQVLLFGAGAGVIAAAQSAFFTGRGATRTVMVVDVMATALNVLLDYCWIFGHFGFPEMGIEGAAWGTVTAQWFKVVLLGVCMSHAPTRRTYHLMSTRSFDSLLFRRLLYFGGPSGLDFFVECGAFAVLTLLMGRLGATALAASTLALNVNMVAFIPMLGIGIAASTLVGQQLTQGRPDRAARATWSAFALAILYTSVFGVLYVLTPDLFLLGHSAGISAEAFGEVRRLTIILLRFVAAYCLLDATQIVFVNAIKGAGDTWFALSVTVLVSGAGVAACWWGAELGVLWWWAVVTVWVSLRGVIFVARFLQGHWQSMRVIEPAEA